MCGTSPRSKVRKLSGCLTSRAKAVAIWLLYKGDKMILLLLHCFSEEINTYLYILCSKSCRCKLGIFKKYWSGNNQPDFRHVNFIRRSFNNTCSLEALKGAIGFRCVVSIYSSLQTVKSLSISFLCLMFPHL